MLARRVVVVTQWLVAKLVVLVFVEEWCSGSGRGSCCGFLFLFYFLKNIIINQLWLNLTILVMLWKGLKTQGYFVEQKNIGCIL